MPPPIAKPSTAALQGRVVRATDPEAELLCDDVVPVDRVDETVEQAVRDLSAPAVLANRGMLHLAEEPPDLFRAYLAEFAYVQAVRMHAPDVVDKVGRFGRSEEASA
jgi:thioesterase DpgC